MATRLTRTVLTALALVACTKSTRPDPPKGSTMSQTSISGVTELSSGPLTGLILDGSIGRAGVLCLGIYEEQQTQILDRAQCTKFRVIDHGPPPTTTPDGPGALTLFGTIDRLALTFTVTDRRYYEPPPGGFSGAYFLVVPESDRCAGAKLANLRDLDIGHAIYELAASPEGLPPSLIFGPGDGVASLGAGPWEFKWLCDHGIDPGQIKIYEHLLPSP